MKQNKHAFHMLRFNTEENDKSQTTPDFYNKMFMLKDYTTNSEILNQQPLISTDLIYSENIQENIGSQFEVIKAEEFSHVLVFILISKSLGIQNFLKIYSIDLTAVTLTRHANNSNIVK